MTTATAPSRPRGWLPVPRVLLDRARRHFASDSRRAVQTVLGLIWVLDGALQFQPFMYGHGFIQAVTGLESGQPHWLDTSINWAAHIFQNPSVIFNTLAALVQVFIGLGFLYRRTVKPAIVLSLVWSLPVWWFGEGFGMLLAGSASPLTGAPGAVLLYALIALLVWPNERSGGLLGVRGARAAWATLSLVMAWAWLLPANTGANATANAIMSAPGSGWLHSLQSSAASGAAGHGDAIAIVLALVSAVIGVAVAKDWRPRPFLALAVVLNVGYWVIGQGFGGIFYTNSATDLNAGPLFVLFALLLFSLTRAPDQATAATGVVAGTHHTSLT